MIAANGAGESTISETTHIAPAGMRCKRPRVSVVMPVKDGHVHLGPAIESICNQSLADFEFLIIDDGSTDETPEIIQRYAAEDERIRVFQGHGDGITKALNLGFAAARAPLIARMDGDDISCPERFARQVAYMSSHKECVALGTSVTIVDTDGDPIGWHLAATDHQGIVDAFICYLGFGIAHPSAMIRKDAFNRIGGYDGQYSTAQDVDLFLRLSEQGRLANLPEVLIQLRLHGGQLSVQRREKQLRNARKIVSDYCARRGLPSPIDDARPIEAVQNDELRFRCNLACRAMRSGYSATAVKHLKQAIRSSPASPQVWIAAARVLRDYWLRERTATPVRGYAPYVDKP